MVSDWVHVAREGLIILLSHLPLSSFHLLPPTHTFLHPSLPSISLTPILSVPLPPSFPLILYYINCWLLGDNVGGTDWAWCEMSWEPARSRHQPPGVHRCRHENSYQWPWSLRPSAQQFVLLVFAHVVASSLDVCILYILALRVYIHSISVHPCVLAHWVTHPLHNDQSSPARHPNTVQVFHQCVVLGLPEFFSFSFSIFLEWTTSLLVVVFCSRPFCVVCTWPSHYSLLFLKMTTIISISVLRLISEKRKYKFQSKFELY